MALQQQRGTAFLLLPCLLALVLSPLRVAATTSFFSCQTELEACNADDACYECLLSWPVGELSTCDEYSDEAAETTAVAAEAGSCEETGVQNCCGFESGTAETCMENAALEAYWECQLEVSGCTLDDMPCSVAGVAADAEANAAEDDEDGGTEDSSASAGGAPARACRFGAGVFGAGMVAAMAAVL
eukprot:g6405.t2